MGKNIDKKRLKEFAQTGKFDVYYRDGKLMSVGLKKGEGVFMKQQGFSRKEQIKYLDFMQENKKEMEKILGIK